MNQAVQFERAIGDCFHLFIPADPETEMRKAIRDAMCVENAVKLMLSGGVSPEELLEMVEPVVVDIDQYIEEVEESLEEIGLA